MQFKGWDGESFHQDKRMIKQIERMEAFSCNNQLCNLADDPRRTYRLPPCMAFLRPTDRIQEPNAKMYSSGLHIPLCVVRDAWELNQNGGYSVRKSNVEDRSLSNETFEQLFNSKLLGGKELSYDELEVLYKAFKLFEYDDTVQIHAQEFSREEFSSDNSKKRKKKTESNDGRKGEKSSKPANLGT